MTLLTMNTWEEGLQSAAAFTRSPDSLENLPLRARETTTTKGVAALTASWATAGEAMDKPGVGGPRYPQTLGGHTRTNEMQGWSCGLRAIWRHDNDTLKKKKNNCTLVLV